MPINNLPTELELLDIVLNKKPIIGTWSAQDLIDRPEMVRENYLQHVRSFVVLNQLGSVSKDDQPTIEEYEKRLIKLVREGGAAKGYITAEYGYGKTSTALFIWNRCEQANIVAVPPFQIQKLHHLISASYGWICYKLSVNYPALLPEAERIYQKYVSRDIQTHGENEEQRRALQKAYQEGRYSLELGALDYIYYFEEMTALVQRANFQGLVIIADELQQYLDPDIKAAKEPISPLFDIVQALMTRRGQLPFALLFSVPKKEWGVINEARGDLVQRLKSDRLALDLGVIYNQNFARELWHQLAHELGFEGLRDRIVQPPTLESLGQISAREDLATGPRTVVDVFNLMTRRYKEQPEIVAPFTPIDLVDAFLSGQISYDNTAKLQQVVNGHLGHKFVQSRPDYQKAIKLMAAFPIDGLPESYFDLYSVRSALEALTQEAQGDIVSYIGGSGFDDKGRPREMRAMLVGMEERKLNTDWLTTTLREFVRNVPERSPRIRELTIKGFQQLLQKEIFKSGLWGLERSLEPNLSENRAYIFKGSFNTTARKYPARLIHTRLLGEGEALRDSLIRGDLAFNFELKLHDDKPDEARLHLPGEITFPTVRTVTFTLNLSHNSGKESYGDLHNTLLPLVSPWKITPALLLSLYAYLEEKRAARLIPQSEDDSIENLFQPVLLEHAINELFNPEIGQYYRAAGPRIVEEAVRQQLEQHYSQYKTFMGNTRWRQDLREYLNALEKLPTPFMRQGQEVYDKGKSELALRIFAKTVPSFETYAGNVPQLLQREGDNWRFVMHPLENQITMQLKSSLQTRPGSNGKPRNYIKREQAWRTAQDGSYREEELQAALDLLQARGFISLSPSGTEIFEEKIKITTVAELREQLQLYTDRLALFKKILPDNVQLDTWCTKLNSLQQIVDHLAKEPAEQTQAGLASMLKNGLTNLNDLILTESNQRERGLAALAQKGLVLNLNTKALDGEIASGLYGNQLEAQRNSLLKESENVRLSVEPLQQTLSELIRLVGQASLSDFEFERLIEEEKRLRENVLRQQQQQGRLKQWLDQYEQARRLLGEAQRFEQRINAVPGKLQTQVAPRLAAWAREVQADLSSLKLNGLTREPGWRENFERLSHEFEDQQQAERDRFLAVQTDYVRFMSQNFPQVSSWPAIAYNQSEPQDSYSRLWNALHESFKQAVRVMHQQVQEVYDRAARLQGGSLANLPEDERTVAQQTLDLHSGKLSAYREAIAKVVGKVEQTEFIAPVQQQGAEKTAELMLKPVLNNFRKLTENLPQSHQAIIGLEERVEQTRLSLREETSLATLHKLVAENLSDGVELGLLLQQLGSGAESWELLSQLYLKGRLRIRVAPVSFEKGQS